MGDDVIRLGGTKTKKKKAATIREQIEKIKTLPGPLKYVASPTATVVLASILGGLLAVPTTAGLGGVVSGAAAKGAVKGAAAAGAALTGTAVLATSATARKVAKEKLSDPTKFGEGLGKVIESTKEMGGKIIDKAKSAAAKPASIYESLKEKIPSLPSIAKGVGVATLAGGALALAPKVISGVKSYFSDDSTGGFATSPVTDSVFSYVPGAVVQAEPIEVTPVSTGTQGGIKPINIRNVINIDNKSSARQTKKYINQMNYIKVRRKRR